MTAMHDSTIRKSRDSAHVEMKRALKLQNLNMARQHQLELLETRRKLESERDAAIARAKSLDAVTLALTAEVWWV